MIIQRIRHQRIIMQIRPRSGDGIPKKRNDQIPLKKSCRKKMPVATFTSRRSHPDLMIRKREIPIKIYSVVHAGPKSQPGGVNQGL